MGEETPEYLTCLINSQFVELIVCPSICIIIIMSNTCVSGNLIYYQHALNIYREVKLNMILEMAFLPPCIMHSVSYSSSCLLILLTENNHDVSLRWEYSSTVGMTDYKSV